MAFLADSLSDRLLFAIPKKDFTKSVWSSCRAQTFSLAEVIV